jgi:2-iminobutanoate/2-iminopropanoate deaminase
MKKRVISTPFAPKAVGPYSQAVEKNGILFVSGQLPIDPLTGEFPAGGAYEQLDQIFKNIKGILDEAGYTFEDVVKATVYLTEIDDFAALNEVYMLYFDEPYPARAAFAVKALPKNARAEVEIIAIK